MMTADPSALDYFPVPGGQSYIARTTVGAPERKERAPDSQAIRRAPHCPRLPFTAEDESWIQFTQFSLERRLSSFRGR